MKDYIVLDLETPNRLSNSMSSIGIVIVEDNQVVEEKYTLINPESHFDDFNIAFTGIGPEDVVDAPTFPEYYENIKDLLQENIIVGQNITFDLSVISKALTRYEMPIPAFKYYCTLNSCKRNLNLMDNSLSYIVKNVLNTTYNAHNAMADAQMTNELFNFLDDYEDKRTEFIKTYSYRPNCKRDFNRQLDYNLNYLYGLIQRVKYFDIDENYHDKIYCWYNDNECYIYEHPLIENILLKVSYILEMDNKITNKEEFIDSFRQIKRSPKYPSSMLKLQVLKGVIDSVICEEIIEKEDLIFIKRWIDKNNINDKSFKKFKKEFNVDSENIRDNLSNYSKYLEDYCR